MNSEKMVLTIVLTSILVIAIPAALFFRQPPDAVFSQSEKELMDFSNKPVVMTPPRSQSAFSGLDCPVKAIKKQEAAAPSLPAVVVKSPAPQKNAGSKPAEVLPRVLTPSLPKVSMIYSGSDSIMAIIDGQMLHEGSSFGRYQVVKIEKTRVQIRSAGKDIWLNVD